MFSNPPTERLRRLNRKLADLDAMINGEMATVPIEIEMFKAAALNGDPHAAEKHREEVIAIQGRVMDNIYARCALMREAGYI